MEGLFDIAARVAGIGGIALMVFLSIAKLIVGKTVQVGQSHSFKLLNRLLVLAGLITVIGIVAWLISLVIAGKLSLRTKEIESGVKFIAQENERQQKIISDRAEATLAGVPLNSLLVKWKFDPAPPWAKDVTDLAFAATERFFYSEDHLGALGNNYLQMITSSLRIDHGLNPAIVAVARGKASIVDQYEGDTKGALEVGQTADTDTMASFNIQYTGPRFEVLIPLVSDWSAAISLGKKEDDPTDPQLSVGDDVGLQREIEKLTKHRFQAEVSRQDTAFVFTWTYGKASLNNAIELSDRSQVLHGDMPRSLNLVIVHEDMNRHSYLKRVRRLFGLSKPDSTSAKEQPAWSRQSELTMIVNGREDIPYLYKVTNWGSDNESERVYEDALDYNFTYTVFHCVR